jgi:quercetin dioxygenase-like cupin family protein
MNRAYVVPAGEGKVCWLLDARLTGKIGAEQTGGKFGMFLSATPPGSGPPPHVHHREDEMFYVLDGEFSFLLADKMYRGSAGSCVFLPKGIPHTFKNVGSREGTFLGFTSPCGFEQFVAAMATPTPPASNELDPAVVQKLMSVAPSFGLDVNPKLTGPPSDAGPCPDGECRELMGLYVTIKLGSADTGGKFTVVQGKTWPGGGPPAHTHRVQDELFYVLEGQYEFLLGDGGKEVHGPGTTVYIPHGVRHTFKNVGTAPGRIFNLHTPGGFEDFFRECSVPAKDMSKQPAMPSAPPDMRAVTDLFNRHGMTL